MKLLRRRVLALNSEISIYRKAHQNFLNAGHASVPFIRRVIDFAPWRRWRGHEKSPLDIGIPWMTYSGIRKLKTILRSGSKVFEWGMGGSTIFFLNHSADVVSIEHDATWFGQAKKAMPATVVGNWTPVLIEPQSCDCTIRDVSLPELYQSSDPNWENASFRDYCNSICSYPNASFDLVVVDGRARPGCLVNAFAKVKAGGWLVLDNAEREHYHPCLQMLSSSEWRFLDLSGPGPCNDYFWSTWFWQRLR